MNLKNTELKSFMKPSLQSRQSQRRIRRAFCSRRLETKMLQVVYTWQLMLEISNFSTEKLHSTASLNHCFMIASFLVATASTGGSFV